MLDVLHRNSSGKGRWAGSGVGEGRGRSLKPAKEPRHRLGCQHIICFIKPHFHCEEKGGLGSMTKIPSGLPHKGVMRG